MVPTSVNYSPVSRGIPVAISLSAPSQRITEERPVLFGRESVTTHESGVDFVLKLFVGLGILALGAVGIKQLDKQNTLIETQTQLQACQDPLLTGNSYWKSKCDQLVGEVARTIKQPAT